MTSHHQQAPVIVQRQQSSRHQRQPSSLPPKSSSSARSPVDPVSSNPPSTVLARDTEAARLPPAAAASGRPVASRQMSAMSDAPSMTTNGAPPRTPSTIPEDAGRQSHHPQHRARKTSIQGSTGTWILGKTIGAGSMGKVKLARKSDGSEQVRLISLSLQDTYAFFLQSKYSRYTGCCQNRP